MRGLRLPAVLLLLVGVALGVVGDHAIGLETTMARRRALLRAETAAAEVAASLADRLARGDGDEVARFRLVRPAPFDPVGASETARLRFAHALHLALLPATPDGDDAATAAFARLIDTPDAGPLGPLAAAHLTALTLRGAIAASAPPPPDVAEGTTETGLPLPLWCAYLRVRRALAAGEPPASVALALERLLDAPGLLDLRTDTTLGHGPDGSDLLAQALHHVRPGLASLPPRLARALEDRAALAQRAHQALSRLHDAPMAVIDDVVAIRGDDPTPMLRLVRPTGLVAFRPNAVPADAARVEAAPPLAGLWVYERPDAGPLSGRGPYVLLIAGLAVYAVAASAILLALARSRRTQAMKEEFVAAVSHEMKTPIAGMSALAEMLADPRPGTAADDPARVRHYAERIHLETARLAATVRNVLDVARIERDPSHLVRLRATDPADALRATVALAAPTFARRGASLIAHVTPATAPLLIDPEALAHVLHNLLDNATKFARSDVEVRAAPLPAPGGYRIEVLDRGPGVPLAERTRIFRQFARGAAAREAAVPGVGLGLHVVARLVHAHGGTIEVGDRDGGGARFIVDLPPMASRIGTATGDPS